MRSTHRALLVVTVLILSSLPWPAFGYMHALMSADSIDQDHVDLTIKWTTLTTQPEGPSLLFGFIEGRDLRARTGEPPYDFAFAEMIASDDWELTDTDNVTYWWWESIVQKRLFWSEKLPFNNRLSPSIFYPLGSFALNIYVGLNGSSPNCDISTQDPLFSVSRSLEAVSVLPYPLSESAYARLVQSVSFLYHLRVEISYRLETKVLAATIALVVLVQPVLLWQLYRKRRNVGNSNYLQMCLGFLLFLPLVLFSFRTSIAPSWITNLDVLGAMFVLMWAILLLHRLRHYEEMVTMHDS